MINKLLHIFLILILNIITSSSTYAAEVFNFDVTEVEIIEEGNKFIGKNGGTATSSDGTIIKANNFEYDKLKNILIAIGDVEIDDKKENIIITSQKVTYFKNKEFIFSEGQSQAINEGIIIDADNFEYNKIEDRKIIFHSKLENDNMILNISDNAGGIPENIMENIFKLNYTTKETGTGVGLYMSSQIVDKIGGDIVVSNIENGVRFSISLKSI